MSGLTTVHRIFRVLQLFLVTICLALAGALIEQQHLGGTPTRVNYSMFVAAFAALCLLYLLPASFIPTIRSSMVSLALDTLVAIFMLCAAIAMAAEMGAVSCSNRWFLIHNGISNGGGSAIMKKRCQEANALTAFEWFAFFAFLVTLVLGVDEIRRDRAGRSLSAGGRTRSQV